MACLSDPFEEARGRGGWRQCVVAGLLGALVVAGCSTEETLRTVGLVEGFLGGVAADEPRAVVVARDVLGAGGSAADAAVALYFTAAVTYPSSASLGAGGACLVYDPEARKVETLDFPAVAPARADGPESRAVAVPGAVRGMFVLHARYGRLRWGRLISPAEELARLGHPVSRALARDLARAAAPLFADDEAARIFSRDGTTPLAESERLVQLDLAAVLTRIRTHGPGDFYSGELAHKFVEGVRAAGGALTVGELRGYHPTWRATVRVPFGHHVVHSAPPPAAGGTMLLELWSMLAQDERYAEAAADARAHLLAEAAMRMFADRTARFGRAGGGVDPARILDDERIAGLMAGYRAERHTPARALSPPPAGARESPAGTSFVVVDGDGGAVACTTTLNRLFGTGRIARGTGIVPAAVAGEPAAAPAPVMMVNHNTGNLFLAAAASGGAAAHSALAGVMARALVDGAALTEAVAAPRVHHGGLPDTTLHEPGLPAAAVAALRRRGHRLAEVAELGRVNAIYCSDGIPRTWESCMFANDPRGHGLATIVQF